MENAIIIFFLAISAVCLIVYYMSVCGQSPETRKRSDWIPFKMWLDDAKRGVGVKDDEDYTNDEYNALHRKK